MSRSTPARRALRWLAVALVAMSPGRAIPGVDPPAPETRDSTPTTEASVSQASSRASEGNAARGFAADESATQAAIPGPDPHPVPSIAGDESSTPPASPSPASPVPPVSAPPAISTAAPPPAPAPGPPKYLLDRLAAGASLGYFNADQSRILSEMHFDFPFVVIREKSVYVRGSLQTSTVKTAGSIHINSFEAQDLEYLVEAGARDYLNNRVAIAAFAGQEGREQLDQQGSRSVRYAGLGFESVGFPRPGGESRFDWRLALGPTLGTEGLDADAVVRGAFLYDLWRGRSSAVGIDGSFDSIFKGLGGMTEYRIGPRWTFPIANGIRATLFAEWIRGRNPLLLDALEGWNFGFKYAEGPYTGPHELPLPDVRGVLSIGRGSSRAFGHFDLDLSSAQIGLFGRPGRVYANLDANLLGGAGTDNLFYIATAGLDVEVAHRVVTGLELYHRSNHTIGEPPPSAGGVRPLPTSLNIIQLGVKTPGWEYADRLSGQLMPGADEGWVDRIEGALIPGVVTDSSFTNARSWDLQAGIRVDLSRRSAALVPFARVFAEWGDVARREYSLGFSTRQNLVIELRYRQDDQYFGNHTKDTFLTGSLFF